MFLCNQRFLSFHQCCVPFIVPSLQNDQSKKPQHSFNSLDWPPLFSCFIWCSFLNVSDVICTLPNSLTVKHHPEIFQDSLTYSLHSFQQLDVLFSILHIDLWVKCVLVSVCSIYILCASDFINVVGCVGRSFRCFGINVTSLWLCTVSRTWRPGESPGETICGSL